MSKYFDGAELKAQRLKKGLKGKELASKIGVSPAYLCQLELGRRGNPDPRLLAKLTEQGLIFHEGKNNTIVIDEVLPRAIMRENLTSWEAYQAATNARLERIEIQLQTLLRLLGRRMRDGLEQKKKVC